MKIKKFIVILMIILFSSLFIYSLYNIVLWKIDSNNTKNVIEDINKNVEIKEKDDNENTVIIENEDVEKSNPYWDYIKLNLMDVDFSKLKEINNDVIGWIKVNGTNINYPFVQTTDNSYYLGHSLDKTKNDAGWAFLDYRNKINDKNTIIYAHGRYDGTMFGTLKNTLNSNWQSNSDNFVIRISNENENTLWQIFSVYKIPTTSDYLQINFGSDEEYINFINLITNRSEYNFNTTVNTNDRILTLSTCYNETDKAVVHAKLIKIETKTN